MRRFFFVAKRFAQRFSGFGVPTRDAPDVAQEVILGALRTWAAFTPKPGVLEGVGRRHWLLRIAVRHAYDYRRRGREVPTAADEIPETPDDAAPADEAIGAREDENEVALTELEKATTPPRWAAFLAHEIEGIPVAAMRAYYGPLILPKPKEDWGDFARSTFDSYHHGVGTCMMGPASNPLAVVDEHLRVHGFENLWIADASIMPTVTHANTNLTSIMIGERASDFIKDMA